MPPEEAAARRDYTNKLIGFDPLAGKLIDPFHVSKTWNNAVSGIRQTNS